MNERTAHQQAMRERGKQLDQVERCYREYVPPQVFHGAEMRQAQTCYEQVQQGYSPGFDPLVGDTRYL